MNGETTKVTVATQEIYILGQRTIYEDRAFVGAGWSHINIGWKMLGNLFCIGLVMAEDNERGGRRKKTTFVSREARGNVNIFVR